MRADGHKVAAGRQKCDFEITHAARVCTFYTRSDALAAKMQQGRKIHDVQALYNFMPVALREHIKNALAS
jgi:hypothetical protein